ncbi:hypothetical protein G647_00525 [Cladophialophora carrionii CBS 160.54]|uniref:SnoaL-like domain-containing protein n=1 Tax=Cladophialophora carrionii CBS 160.54 TaxID=1279043 RepID=V9DN42_9EURO|nr:uncharacterized protein G647_00525 [Cladophialophora carrionii CBS 160.54]ETI28076.1 hypothetical protein G647_00525 [Cladophialophora carrionii CBS 160.54]
MVRIDVGGFPNINIATTDGKFDIPKTKQQIRQRMRGGGRTVHLSWNTTTPRIVLTSDTDDFDPTIISHFQQEGFQLSYLEYDGNKQDYMAKLQHLQDPLELGEKYAIVAYGDAATLVLEACMKPMPKLVAVVAYYPGHPPRSTTNFPPTLHVQIHLAATQKWGTRWPSYRYENTEPGFAEHDLEEFDKIGASLAWTRTLSTLRTAFDIDGPDLEAIWVNHTRLEFAEKDADKTMAPMVAQPYVNHVPTMTGGIGYDQLRRFYADFFIPNNPPDMRIRLLSRTVGVDRVVDEMFVSFTHTTEISWMLPGVPPTGKKVEVVLVSVVCIRGGKLYHEHIHWDQATVLVQIGLLDPKYIPKTFKTAEEGREDEVERLPVCGREAARKVLDEDSSHSNELIPDW